MSDLGSIMAEALRNRKVNQLDLSHRPHYKVYGNGCVKLAVKDHTISIAADGTEVILEDSYGKTVEAISMSETSVVEAIVKLRNSLYLEPTLTNDIEHKLKVFDRVMDQIEALVASGAVKLTEG